MTKAEAIAMLKRIQEPEAWEPQINQAAFEALDMAIKALEKQDRIAQILDDIGIVSVFFQCPNTTTIYSFISRYPHLFRVKVVHIA